MLEDKANIVIINATRIKGGDGINDGKDIKRGC